MAASIFPLESLEPSKKKRVEEEEEEEERREEKRREKRREENEKTMATMAARECAKRLGFGLGLRQIGANTPLALVPATQTQGLSNAATASSSFSSSASCCSFSSRSRACVDRNSKGSVSSRVSGLPFVNGGHAVRGLTTKTPDDKGAELLESLEHATGLELAEKEGKARGIDIFTEGEAWLSAPFGTPEKPVSSPNEKDRKCS